MAIIVPSTTTTAGDLITLCLKGAGIIGVGETALAEDTNDALSLLNLMLADWSSKRWLIYHLKDYFLASTGALSYTVGPGGDFNMPRPDRIDAAFARQNTGTTLPIDYPISVITSKQEYYEIALKSLASFPEFIFLDSDFPLGTVYWYPIPSIAFELHVAVKDQLASFASLTQTFSLPNTYFSAIYWNLEMILREAYDKPARDLTTRMALSGQQSLRNENAQVPTLSLPRELLNTRGRYNIYSDTSY